MTTHRGYLVVKRKITFDEGQTIRSLGLEWIGIQASSQRHYPKGWLAAHVLGGVDFEENGNAGNRKGVEQHAPRLTRRGAPAHRRKAPWYRFAAGRKRPERERR